VYARILVPLDGSPAAHHALRHAIQLAKEQGAQLRLVHVADTCVYWDAGFVPMDIDQLREALRENGRTILKAGAALVEDAGLSCESELIEVDAPQRGVVATLVAHADAWPTDLIVIGTRAPRYRTRLAGKRGRRRRTHGEGAGSARTRSCHCVM
jgi:nucleotide-binding universal stress UspA family protein